MAVKGIFVSDAGALQERKRVVALAAQHGVVTCAAVLEIPLGVVDFHAALFHFSDARQGVGREPVSRGLD